MGRYITEHMPSELSPDDWDIYLRRRDGHVFIATCDRKDTARRIARLLNADEARKAKARRRK